MTKSTTDDKVQSMSEKNFTVWLFRERYWREGQKGRKVGTSYAEPAEAADAAEAMLSRFGVEGQSYAELRFNGDKQPHTVICYMAENEFGIWNTELAPWPIFYPPEGAGLMLSGFPFEEAPDGNSWQEKDEADKSQESDEGDMKLDEIDSAEEEDEVESQDEEDESDEDEDDTAESEEDSGEDEEDDSGDDGSDELDDFTEDEDDREDSEEDGEDLESDDDDLDGDEETEIEMPRLRIFAKFRGPLGWRKRAEAEELQERNTFALKLGILDDEAEKTKDQEKETFFEIQFIESDDNREQGLLRMKMPEGIEWSEPTKAGWITASIPYRQGE